jgi:hypothetical protein
LKSFPNSNDLRAGADGSISIADFATGWLFIALARINTGPLPAGIGLEHELNGKVGILGPGGPDSLVRARGRAVGAIVCAGFGAYSLYWWTQAAIEGDRRPWFGAIAAVTAILVVWAIATLTSLRHAPRVILNKRLARFYRIGYGLIVAIEGAAISVGGPILGHFHRPDLYGQWIGAVVGLHFFPLGKLFKIPLYYGTGAAISLAAFGSLLVAPGPLRSVISAGGTGLALWITAVVILSENLDKISGKSES